MPYKKDYGYELDCKPESGYNIFLIFPLLSSC
jgi:hypothetical protein